MELSTGFSRSIADELELLQLLEVHPRLHPNLRLVQLLDPSISCFNGDVVHGASNDLLFRFHNLPKLQKGILKKETENTFIQLIHLPTDKRVFKLR